ncbi:hypothetical protein GSI_02179 [Ganoderma sinense ZZ0214-1]|uniref:Uncharacterized protein n=1 Tax=Ganoderma sinense ZZ0214-1 TaxID=1077348 RepID=A0A2G8SNW9_9APHY|nr:hypothetical protein GSI_02179 [Ganoderma sinense ZZ0214-1]
MMAEKELTAIFRAHPHALPNLHAFKLSSSDYHSDDIAALAEFLRPKRHLHLLDVTVTSRWIGSDPHLCPALPLSQLMSALPDLRVVGLGFNFRAAQQHTISYMERYLPRNLTALLLWRGSSSRPDSSSKPWINLFAGYKSLRYLHISPGKDDEIDLQADILRSPPPSLELFGYGRQIHPIGRDLATGAAVVRPRWPYPKVYFRTADDFGNAGWEWLLRHHGDGGVGHWNFMRDADSLR